MSPVTFVPHKRLSGGRRDGGTFFGVRLVEGHGSRALRSGVRANVRDYSRTNVRGSVNVDSPHSHRNSRARNTVYSTPYAVVTPFVWRAISGSRSISFGRCDPSTHRRLTYGRPCPVGESSPERRPRGRTFSAIGKSNSRSSSDDIHSRVMGKYGRDSAARVGLTPARSVCSRNTNLIKVEQNSDYLSTFLRSCTTARPIPTERTRTRSLTQPGDDVGGTNRWTVDLPYLFSERNTTTVWIREVYGGRRVRPRSSHPATTVEFRPSRLNRGVSRARRRSGGFFPPPVPTVFVKCERIGNRTFPLRPGASSR